MISEPSMRRPTPAHLRQVGLALAMLVFLLGTGTQAGCDRDELPDSVRQPVELNAVPEVVRAAATRALPGVTLQDAWKNLDRTSRALHSYEVRGKAPNGKVREVRVSPTGEVLELE